MSADMVDVPSFAGGYKRIMGQCDPMEIAPGVQEWLEDDVSLVKYQCDNYDDSEEDDGEWSTSSAGSMES